MNHCIKTIVFLVALTWIVNRVPADETLPGKVEPGPVVLQGGVLHTVSGDTIDDGSLVIVDGKIAEVGQDVKIPDGARVIDLEGKHVYPGMFEAHSQMGITELGSIRPTHDFDEAGDINPNVTANLSVNPDNMVIPVTRANGVLLALSAPTGGLIAGKSSVLQLDGWTYEDLTLKAEAAMQIRWPSQSISARRMARMSEDEVQEMRERQKQDIVKIRELFEQARLYQQGRQNDEIDQPLDLRLEALGAVVNGQLPIMVAANGLSEIQSAVAFAVEQDVKIIILGGYDAPHCAALLKQHDVPVIVSSVYRLPNRRDDLYDHAYTLPERLRQAGIKYCISGTDRSETWNTRILPYHAATAVAYGLPVDEAIKSITLYPAEILGVSDRVGSLDVGKDATLFVADGNPLETTTNVLQAFVRGREIDLSSRHTRLYDKYKQKYERQKQQ